MNDKLNFVKLFFDSGKYSVDVSHLGEIADHFPAIVYTYEPKSRTLRYVNKRFLDFFNLTHQEVEQFENPLRMLIPDEPDQIKVENLVSGIVPSFSCETRFITHDQTYTYLRTHGSVLRAGAEGKPETLLFLAQDITDEYKAKEEADLMRKLFEETEEMLEYGTWTLDVPSNRMTMTPGLLRLLGYHTDVTGPEQDASFYLNHTVNGYHDGLAEMIRQSISDGGDFQYEYVIQSIAGERRTVFTKAKTIKSANDSVIKIIGITRDLSALRNIQKDQERHIRDLNRSNKELEEFAYIASHDLQEPLRKISMFTERLKAKVAPTSDKDSELLLDRIMASSASMRMLIDNLLEFSRINRSSQNFANLELQKPLDQAISDLERKIEETNSVIKVFGEMPTLEAVEPEMKQLFNNLISNSIKFRKAGCPAEISITINRASKDEKKHHRLGQQKTYYKIEFSDKGIGFESEYAEKIFQIFQRLHGKAEYPGSGIGLAICKKIVENHNGVIYAHSVLEEGSTFTIVLPEKQF